MAIGFPASYTERIELDISRSSARNAVAHAFDRIGWHFEMLDADTFKAFVSVSGYSWGEFVTVSLSEASILQIRSACRNWQIIDWGKNKKNVEQFLSLFEARAAREEQLNGGEPAYLDDDGKTPVERVIG